MRRRRQTAASTSSRHPHRRSLSLGSAQPVVLGIGLMIPFYILMLGLVVYPIVKLITTASASPGAWANFRAFFTSHLSLKALRVTLVDSLIVTFLVVLLGAIVAWSLRTTTRRGWRLFLLVAVVAPLVMNSILKVFAFTVLLERNGIVNRTLIALHLIKEPIKLLYTEFAVVLGMLYYMFPYAVLPLYVAFLALDLDLLTVAQSLGASRKRALLNVALPLALPGVFATVIISYVLCLGFFLMPLLLGGISVPFTSNVVWQDVTDFFDLTSAAVSSLVLLTATFLVVAVGYAAIGRERLLRAVA